MASFGVFRFLVLLAALVWVLAEERNETQRRYPSTNGSWLCTSYAISKMGLIVEAVRPPEILPQRLQSGILQVWKRETPSLTVCSALSGHNTNRTTLKTWQLNHLSRV
ncbi:unnamed protein product [Chrysodeixis includens]|uniref:Secreted protein n=1 Tax=Chrysodeixis includens TaxID=689277 RepID=A0A9N8KYI0_CHRIL|nr:unnamed protein product [Chrysodeixis includens]